MDNDGTNEYLLFVTYDNIAISGSSQAQIGPIGALMLDTIPPARPCGRGSCRHGHRYGGRE
ncbi:MAG: hypothetical protein R2911_04915 [Caldilineaceae bacterium]